MELDHSLTLYTKINSKWIKGLTVRSETMELIEENIGRKVFDISLTEIFPDISPQSRETKAKTNKWDIIRLKSFFIEKETINTTRQPIEKKNIFANNISDKGLSKIHKDHIQLSNKKISNPIKKWAEDRKRHTDGKHTYEKLLKVTNHRGNANQNYNEVSPYVY